MGWLIRQQPRLRATTRHRRGTTEAQTMRTMAWARNHPEVGPRHTAGGAKPASTIRVATTAGPGYGPPAMPQPLAIVRFPAALAVALTFALTALVGCPKPEEKPAPKDEKPAPTAKAEKMAKPTSSDPDCIGVWTTDGVTKNFKIGSATFELRGAHLKQTNPDDDAKIVLGVLANTKEDTADNMANIKSVLAFFKREGVQAIVIAGDIAESQPQIANVLKPIAETGLPVFVIIGNREPKADFNQAVAKVASEHPNLINLNMVRLVTLDDVALVSAPGYYDPSYIHAKNGCHYVASDLDVVGALKKAAGDLPVVMVSHGPPRQDGAEAIDRTQEQANVGDPALAAAMKKAGIKFGIFSNIQEAGGKATDVSGKTIINPETLADALLLNPGAVDSVSWPMNDGTRSVGMAAVMTMDGGQASYKVHRIPEKG